MLGVCWGILVVYWGILVVYWGIFVVWGMLINCCALGASCGDEGEKNWGNCDLADSTCPFLEEVFTLGPTELPPLDG